MPLIDLNGQRFGRLTVVERGRMPGGASAWVCRCDCGIVTQPKTSGQLKKSIEITGTASCGCVPFGRLIDLTGQRYGRLTVVERSGRIGSYAAWVCRCDCGALTKPIRSGSLRSGVTKSCGCLAGTEDLSGQKFGLLTVTGRAPNGRSREPRWFCICDCGKTTGPVRGHALKRGLSASCGHTRAKRTKRAKSRQGQVFGRLTVISKQAAGAGRGKYFWTCRCSCGSVTSAREDQLLSGRVASCGCKGRERPRANFECHACGSPFTATVAVAAVLPKWCSGRCRNEFNRRRLEHSSIANLANQLETRLNDSRDD